MSKKTALNGYFVPITALFSYKIWRSYLGCYTPATLITEKNKIMIKKATLTGLLLFGMFFGAGNLIFPPSLGALSGENFWQAISGFVLSGVGIAILTLVIGALNPKGYVYEISIKIAP